MKREMDVKINGYRMRCVRDEGPGRKSLEVRMADSGKLLYEAKEFDGMNIAVIYPVVRMMMENNLAMSVGVEGMIIVKSKEVMC